MTTIPQGGTGDVKYHHGAQGTYQCGDAAERARAAGVQPVAPRVRRAGRRGRHARRPDLAPGHARDAGHQRRGLDHPARRRRLPRPGRRRGDVQPAGARRLHRRRRAAPDHRTTRSASRPTRTTRAPRAGPRTSRRASTSRSSTSTPTTSRACISAVRLAFAFRQEFGHDVLIDLIGYRRYGHNEADEPAYTQPEMTAKIKAKKPVRELYAASLVQRRARSPRRRRTRSRPRSGTTSPAATASSRSSSRAPATSSPRAATSSTARPRPRSRPRSPPSGCSRSTRSCCGSPRASPCTRSWSSSSSAGAQAIGPDGGIDWAQAESLGLRLAADRGHAGAPDRPGRRARHVLPAPPGAARPEDRPADLADPDRCRARWRRWSCTTRR